MNKMLILFILTISISSCSFIFYQPDRVLYARPEAYGVEYSEQWLTASDGTKLHSWFLKNKKGLKKPEGLFLYFHGNAQNLSSHFVNLVWLTDHGYDVFIFDYRGYGLNDGQANQQGVHKDALAAFEFAHKKLKEGGHKKFIVYGQSLGGNIMARGLIDFPHRKDIDLLIFDSTFSSYQDIAFKKLKSIPLTFVLSPLAYLLVSDRFGAYKHLDKITRPALVIHGQRDNVVNPEHGKYIFDNIASKKKWFWPIPGGRHVDVYYGHQKRYRKKLLKFLKTI